jgi:cytokinin dehydrogenase
MGSQTTQAAGSSDNQLDSMAQHPFASVSNFSDPVVLQSAQRDFGQIAQGHTQTILQPKDMQELAAILKSANQAGLSVTPRGRGRSQSGQAISPSGVTLDTSCFDSILYSDRQSDEITCGAGVTWRQIMASCQIQGQLPFVMPLNLDLSLGGTLSAGGFGANSHRYGPAIAHVKALEVVTGAGDLTICSAQLQPEVFHAMLGGLGRCGVIGSATLALRPFKPNIRTYYLLYEDLEPWLADQQRLAQMSQVDYLEGFCSASIQGLHKTEQGRRPFFHWQYGLHIGTEFNPDETPQDSLILEGLQYRRLLLTEDDATVEYAARYDARFRAMRQSGAWEQAHPWFECMLPFDAAQTFISDTLKLLPPYFGDGHRVIMLADTDSSDQFMRPAAPAIIFAILPTGISEAQLPEALETLVTLNERLIQCGGKRYLSGWLGQPTKQFWQTHFGDRYEQWRTIKQTLDPNLILRSVLFP